MISLSTKASTTRCILYAKGTTKINYRLSPLKISSNQIVVKYKKKKQERVP